MQSTFLLTDYFLKSKGEQIMKKVITSILAITVFCITASAAVDLVQLADSAGAPTSINGIKLGLSEDSTLELLKEMKAQQVKIDGQKVTATLPCFGQSSKVTLSFGKDNKKLFIIEFSFTNTNKSNFNTVCTAAEKAMGIKFGPVDENGDDWLEKKAKFGKIGQKMAGKIYNFDLIVVNALWRYSSVTRKKTLVCELRFETLQDYPNDSYATQPSF